MDIQEAKEEAGEEAENIIQFIDAVKELTADAPEPPEGWIGGNLRQTGGLTFSRIWINPEKGLGIAYSHTDLYVIVGDAELMAEDADPGNPQSYNVIQGSNSSDLQGMNQNVESDEEGLELAQAIMEDINEGKIEPK